MPQRSLWEHHQHDLREILSRRQGRWGKGRSAVAKAIGRSNTFLADFLDPQRAVSAKDEDSFSKIASACLEVFKDDCTEAEREKLDRIRLGLATIHDCMTDFMGWESSRNAKNGRPYEIEMQAIALEMTYGRENLDQLFRRSNASKIRIKLLMLASDLNGSPVDASTIQELRAWCHGADAQYRLFLDGCEKFDERKHPVCLEIKRYSDPPTYHGVQMKIGDTSRFYVTKCFERRGALPGYSWGEGNYRIIRNDHLTADRIEYRNAFTDRFDLLWKQPGEMVSLGSYLHGTE